MTARLIMLKTDTQGLADCCVGTQSLRFPGLRSLLCCSGNPEYELRTDNHRLVCPRGRADDDQSGFPVPCDTVHAGAVLLEFNPRRLGAYSRPWLRHSVRPLPFEDSSSACSFVITSIINATRSKFERSRHCRIRLLFSKRFPRRAVSSASPFRTSLSVTVIPLSYGRQEVACRMKSCLVLKVLSLLKETSTSRHRHQSTILFYALEKIRHNN